MSSMSDPAQVRMDHLALDMRDATVDQLAKALTEEIERLRGQLDRTNTERQRLADELAVASAELAEVKADRLDIYQRATDVEDRLKGDVEQLRGVLRDILGHFTDKGRLEVQSPLAIAGIHNSLRTCWVTTSKVDGWRAAPNGEAGERRG